MSGLLLRPVRLEPAADAILLELRKPYAPAGTADRAPVQP